MSHEEMKKQDNQGKIDFVWVYLYDKVYLLTEQKYYDEANQKWKQTPVMMHGYAIVYNFVSFGALSDEAKANFFEIKKALIERVNKGRSDLFKFVDH